VDERLRRNGLGGASLLTWVIMKTRHAAALALVVYLLVPPFNGGPDSTACASGSTAACLRQTFNPAAPIGDWRLLEAFDTAEVCKTFRDDRIQMLEKCPRPQLCPATPELTRFNLDMIQQSRCVSRDDLLKLNRR
jgi:hypothetical protein